jgi:hypothetical protein
MMETTDWVLILLVVLLLLTLFLTRNIGAKKSNTRTTVSSRSQAGFLTGGKLDRYDGDPPEWKKL